MKTTIADLKAGEKFILPGDLRNASKRIVYEKAKAPCATTGHPMAIIRGRNGRDRYIVMTAATEVVPERGATVADILGSLSRL